MTSTDEYKVYTNGYVPREPSHHTPYIHLSREDKKNSVSSFDTVWRAMENFLLDCVTTSHLISVLLTEFILPGWSQYSTYKCSV